MPEQIYGIPRLSTRKRASAGTALKKPSLPLDQLSRHIVLSGLVAYASFARSRFFSKSRIEPQNSFFCATSYLRSTANWLKPEAISGTDLK